MTSSLELPARPAKPKPSRTTNIVLVVLAVLLPLAWLIWFVNTPPDLSTSERETTGSAVAGNSIYVGMYNAPSGFDRTIEISGVKVDVRASTDVDVRPLLCRDGAVGVTTQPDQFCRELIDPEGEEFGADDSVVVEVRSSDAAVVEIDQIRIGFHQDIRSATRPAGIAGATVTFSGRPTG